MSVVLRNCVEIVKLFPDLLIAPSVLFLARQTDRDVRPTSDKSIVTFDKQLNARPIEVESNYRIEVVTTALT